MIKALIDIGRSTEDLYPMPLVEVPYLVKEGKKEPKVLVLSLMERDGGNLVVNSLEVVDYDPEHTGNRYFFRNPPASQGPAASLSFKLPGKYNALKQRLGVLATFGYIADSEYLAKTISEKIEEFKNTGILDKNSPVLISIKINEKWPADNEKLRNSFIQNFLEDVSSYKKKPLWRKEGRCHACGKNGVIYGGIGSILKFYTVDKYGYAPEVDPKSAWKQYALCEDCIFALQRGKRTAEQFLTFSFYGKRFWLLPVSTSNLRNIIERFRTFTGKIYQEGYAENIEDRLLYEAAVQKEAISYQFLFFRSDNQALRILLHIHEVLPSVLQKYVDTKEKIEKRFKNSLESIGFKDRQFSFNFFSSKALRQMPDKPGFTEKNFFDLVDRVFRRNRVDELFLIAKAMSRIKKELADSGEQGKLPWWTVLETLISLEFLNAWGILKRKTEGGEKMNNAPYSEFFEQHGDFFNHPSKKALVLLGVLVQNFLSYQFNERGSTPFMKVLKNLRLDQKDVQNLFVSLQNKMNEYGIPHFWRDLKESISIYLVESGSNWNLSPDEIGFYTAVGMSLYSHEAFRKDKHEDEVKEEKNGNN